MPNPYRAGNGQFASKGGGGGSRKSSGSKKMLSGTVRARVSNGRSTTTVKVSKGQAKGIASRLVGASPAPARRRAAGSTTNGLLRSKGVTALQGKYSGGVLLPKDRKRGFGTTLGRKTSGPSTPFGAGKLGGANKVNQRALNQSIAAGRSAVKNRRVSGNMIRATNVAVGSRSRTGTLSEGMKVYRGRGFGGSSNGKKNRGLVKGSAAYRVSSLDASRKISTARQDIVRNRRAAASGGVKVKSRVGASKPLQTKLRGSLRVNASAIRTTKPYGPKPAKSSAKVAAGIAGYVGRQQRIYNASKRKK